MQLVKVSDVAVLCGIMVRVNAEHSDAVAVLVRFLNQHPHSFTFVVCAIGVFGSETKHQFDIFTGSDILTCLFARRVNIGYPDYYRMPSCSSYAVPVITCNFKMGDAVATFNLACS